MIETILTTVLSTTLLLKTPTFSTIPQTPQFVFTRVLPQENYVSYVAKKNNTLKSIAFTYYGSEDYWINLWNDNPWIANPTNLEAGSLVKIRTEKPQTVDQLAENLTQQMNANGNNQQEYPVGAKPTTASVPSITQSPTTVNNASTITDEAINYLGTCEAGMNPSKNTGNGYYGAFQFSYGTWKSMNSGYERADLAPIEVQKAAVKQLLQRSSIFSQFPGCAAKMRSTGLI